MHVIAVFDDQKQVSDMYSHLGCYYPELSVVLDRKAILSCMYCDLGKEGRLFTLTDPFGADARLYHSGSCTYKELYGDDLGYGSKFLVCADEYSLMAFCENVVIIPVHLLTYMC